MVWFGMKINICLFDRWCILQNLWPSGRMSCTLKCFWRSRLCQLLFASWTHAVWLLTFMGLQGVTTTAQPTFFLADLIEVVLYCTVLLHHQGGWRPHPLTFTSSRYATRDGTPSLSLTPNCRWSDLHWADAEWRLDKRNHPDSRGWSGWWLAAAPAPQLGP